MTASADSPPKRMIRQIASVTKNVFVLTWSAPAASTKAVNGNGGGTRSRTARAMAPLRRTLARTFARRLARMYRWSRLSPMVRPIQNVSQAPASDPAVASNGTIHARARSRAANRMTAASIPNGSDRNTVESSAASTTTPSGETNSDRTQRVKGRMRGGLIKQRPRHAGDLACPSGGVNCTGRAAAGAADPAHFGRKGESRLFRQVTENQSLYSVSAARFRLTPRLARL